ncbi:MAG: hypothetical protein V7647_1805 [Acidobacteriota bacterium]|jgi:uncharacterized OsmC-like protein
MKPFPHDYAVNVSASPVGDLEMRASGVPVFLTAAPVEFDGPGNRWSPETPLVAAVGDCFVLTFRAVAARMELPWTSVRCEVRGILERKDGLAQFTAFTIHTELMLLPGASAETARRALVKSKDGCLIANSLKAVSRLEMEIETVVFPRTA